MTSSQMTVNVSGQLNHDLREPINAIKRKLELLELQDTSSIRGIEARANYVFFVRHLCRDILEAIQSLRNSVLLTSMPDDEFHRRIDLIVRESARLSNYTARIDQIWPPNTRDSSHERHLNFIRATSVRFQKMLRALLTVAKIAEPTFTWTNYLNQAVRASDYIIERLTAADVNTNADHIFEWDNTSVSGNADQGMILTIFQNLYENAIKYQSPDRRPHIVTSFKEMDISAVLMEYPITASALKDSTGKFLQIIVKDNGIGIPMSYATRIFDAYYQIDKIRSNIRTKFNEDKSEEKDVGIGLYTVRKMVTAHHGYVLAESDGATETTFRIFLPNDPTRMRRTK